MGEPISTGLAVAAVAGAAGKAYQGIESNNAASAQRHGINQGQIDVQSALDNYIKTYQPYLNQGNSAVDALTKRLPQLSSPINISQNWLESTPGYQFALNQGEQAVQSAASAKGLGGPGSTTAQQDSAKYATGLAEGTYQQQFQAELAQRQQQFEQLLKASTLGQSAAGNVGEAQFLTGKEQASLATNTGIATSLGDIARGNAVSGGINSFTSPFTNYTQETGLNPFAGFYNKTPAEVNPAIGQSAQGDMPITGVTP